MSLDNVEKRFALQLALKKLDAEHEAPRDCERLGFATGKHIARPRGRPVLLHPYAYTVNTRNIVVAYERLGRLVSVWRQRFPSRSKYKPHQGKRECARRAWA